MDIDEYLEEAINRLEGMFHRIEKNYAPPEFIDKDGYPRFRHKNQNREIAIILKAARMISSLYACQHLLRRGYIQEIGVISRTIDEFNEEIIFLLDGMKDGKLSEQQQKFLDDFYQEEFDIPAAPLLSPQKRDRLPRKKIQAVVGKVMGEVSNPSDAQELQRTISGAFSGYVHGAYPHIMEIYGGSPPRYHLNGMLGTPRIGEWRNHLVQYVYRVLLCVTLITQVFNLQDEFQEMISLRDEYERTLGIEVKDPRKVLRELKKGKV